MEPVSVDGRGTVTLHWPAQGKRSVPLEKGGLVLLDFALEYNVRCENESGFSISAAAIEEGGQFVLDLQDFITTTQEPVVLRGGREAFHPQFGGVDGRFRIGMRLGSWYHSGLGSTDSNYIWDTSNLAGGMQFSYWLSEKWSLDFTAWSTMYLVQEQNPTPDGGYIAAFLFGGKRYFPGLGGLPPNIKPFLLAAVGPYYRNATPQDVGTVSGVAAGGNVGGGFDIQPARWCMVDVKLGYNFTSDFTSDFTGTFGRKTSYSGYELAIGFSVLLGKGNTPDS